MPGNKPDLTKLTRMQYKVTQEKFTERPFTGKFNAFKQLGCGWPAFYDSIDKSRIKEILDESAGMIRTEVLCSKCDAHLGHVFDDGPKPTRRRFCINSAAMRFISQNGTKIDDSS